jgi:periplasmic protein TonB
MNDHDVTGSLCTWLIRRAARQAPPELAARLEEEWLADLASRSTRGSRLGLAVGCSWATHVIARDQIAVPRLAAASSASARVLETHPGRLSAPLSPRVIAVIVIALMHASVIYVLARALMHSNTALAPQAMTAEVLPELPHSERPLPPPAPHLQSPWVEIPPPLVLSDASSGEVLHEPPLPPEPPQLDDTVPAKPLTHTGGPAAGFPNTDDYYPLAAKRMGEQGVSAIQVCVDAHGRLTADPTLATSSGSARLDGAALQLARAGSGHYRPTTEDGRPVSACYAFRIRFALRN